MSFLININGHFSDFYRSTRICLDIIQREYSIIQRTLQASQGILDHTFRQSFKFHVALIGLPVPKKLKEVLEQLHEEADEKKEDE